MQFIGIDLGSSSIKVAVVDGETGMPIALEKYPESEMTIDVPQPLWAEQDPELWWTNLVAACRKILKAPGVDRQAIRAIGIGYQMHGLVLCDEEGQVLRPSIIWCDSRAIPYGEQAYAVLGERYCRQHLLNSPGNFTAAKMKWVLEYEPDIGARTRYLFLPGDYLAFRMTGSPSTTLGGLSEGVFWDFNAHDLARPVLDHFGIPENIIPNCVPNLGLQGELQPQAARELGLPAGISLTYRAGDQPNNALSLGVLHPGEVAGTGGTSGVIYGLVDKNTTDPSFRVNAFAHVNHTREVPRLGVLLCINGTGIQYNWLRQHLAGGQMTYDHLEEEANRVPVGSEGLLLYPFGNGAERMLNQAALGASWQNLDFNRHHSGHVIRAGLEGIAFSFVYGMEIMQQMGVSVDMIRVGNDNLFRSRIFSNTVAQVMGSTIDVIDTTGAIGAARGAAFGLGYYASLEEATRKDKKVISFGPTLQASAYQTAYRYWKEGLDKQLKAL